MDAVIKNGKYNEGKFKSNNLVTLVEWCFNSRGKASFEIVSGIRPYKTWTCHLRFAPESKGFFHDGKKMLSVEANFYLKDGGDYCWSYGFDISDDGENINTTIKEFELKFLKNSAIDNYVRYVDMIPPKWYFCHPPKERPIHGWSCIIRLCGIPAKPVYRVVAYDADKDEFYDGYEHIPYENVFHWCYLGSVLEVIENNTPDEI